MLQMKITTLSSDGEFIDKSGKLDFVYGIREDKLLCSISRPVTDGRRQMGPESPLSPTLARLTYCL